MEKYLSRQYDSVWYSWIPTNTSSLNFDYIGIGKGLENYTYKSRYSDSENFEIRELSTNFISDTFADAPNFIKEILPSINDEIYSNVDLVLKNLNDVFEGQITIRYPDGPYTANATIRLEKNGKLEISNLNTEYQERSKLLYDKFGSEEAFIDSIIQIFFIIIKGIVHGDNHHHQKIDVAITIIKGRFDKNLIVDNLIKHVKNIEFDIKKSKQCGDELKIRNSIEEMNGYKSYIKSFSEVFIQPMHKSVHHANMEKLDNILLSLKSSVEAYKNKMDVIDKRSTFILTYTAIGVSLVILFIKAKFSPSIVINLYDSYALLLIFFTIIGKHLGCRTKSIIFYDYYYLSEYFYHLRAIDYKEISFLNKMFKFFQKYGEHTYYLFLGALASFIFFSHYIYHTEENLTSQINYELQKSFTVHFDKSSIEINPNEIKFLENEIDNMSENKNYLVKINGFSSFEKFKSTNTFSDNYQLSKARAENLKSSIIEMIIKKKKFLDNVKFTIDAKSNVVFDKQQKRYKDQRICEVTLYTRDI